MVSYTKDCKDRSSEECIDRWVEGKLKENESIVSELFIESSETAISLVIKSTTVLYNIELAVDGTTILSSLVPKVDLKFDSGCDVTGEGRIVGRGKVLSTVTVS